ncbi:MAG: hypothetical protein WDW38_000964 [Sanguina aurantia]
MRSRFIQQFWALYKKNALVAWRNRRATILRILAPLFFLLLALLIDRALSSQNATDSSNVDVRTPTDNTINSIPSCHSDLYIAGKSCVELLYSPNTSPIAQTIMGNVVSRNPINISAVGFGSQDAVQSFLFGAWDYSIAAVHFVFDDAAATQLAGFIVQTNTSQKFFKGQYQDPNTFVQLPLQSAVQREIARYLLSQDPNPTTAAVASSLTWNAGYRVFAHPTIATTSVLSQVLGPFVFAACMFSFITQIGTVVTEKSRGCASALRTMGMTDAAYWLSWGAWEVTLSFLIAHIIAIFGLILQFNLFLKNSYGILFFLFFLFQLAMSSLGFVIAAFLAKTQIAVYLGFVVFIVGWVMQTVVAFGVPYSPSYYNVANGALSGIFDVLPWNLLAKGFGDLGAATISDGYPGIAWSQRDSYCLYIPNIQNQPSYNPSVIYYNFNCVMSMNTIYQVYIALWLGFFVVAIYLDNILPNEHGVRKPFYYFLLPSYWIPSTQTSSSLLQALQEGRGGREEAPQEGAADQDVLIEEEKMRALLQHRTGRAGSLASEAEGRKNAIEVFQLEKRYAGSLGCFGKTCSCCCFECTSTQPFWAIRGSWFAIEENQLFCLLGPNGAGKTTTINCLTGVLPPTHGEALIYGEAIGNPSGMDRVRAMMGVCPQFDVLWEELSGTEHLHIYAAIKGIPQADITDEALGLMEKVKLTYAANQRSSAYSGGMKRRLSVAIALLGNPKVVYLDEPTTGMDPISRRYVWDIIQEAKVGRAIVLTTHSMEEADILGDKIAIMARGKLRCLGSALHLKQRFGAGYQVAVSVMSIHGSSEDPKTLTKRAEGVKAYFQARMGLAPVEESRAYISYLVERKREADLISFLKDLEQDQASLGVTDIQLSLTSLEEVFLTIAKQAELDAAASSGSSDVTITTDDGVQLIVPMGAELVMNPNTRTQYKVKWSTDEGGRLVVMSTTAVQALAPVCEALECPALAASSSYSAPYHASIPIATPVVNEENCPPGYRR